MSDTAHPPDLIGYGADPPGVRWPGEAGEAVRGGPAALRPGDWEVACHGRRWIDSQCVAENIERDKRAGKVEVITPLIGRPPVGWYTGRPGPNTRRLVVESGGFLYDSDAYSDDLPYWTRVDRKPHLVVPYAFDTNDSRLQRGADFACGEDYFGSC